MKRHASWSLVLAGLLAGIVLGGCASKQIREEGAVVPPNAAAASPEQPARRAEIGATGLDKKESAVPREGSAGQAPKAEVTARAPAPPPPPKSGALEPAPKAPAVQPAQAPVPGAGLPGESKGALSRIHFDFDQAALTPESREILARNAAYLKQATAARVRIEGHCDERGSAEYNLALGERRAKSAFQYLVDLGISPARLSTVTFGKEAPLDAGHNEDAWAKNRRAEFVGSSN